MKLVKIIIPALLVLIVSACANVQVKPLGKSSDSLLQNKTMVVVNYGPGPFVAMTAGKAGFGLLGAAAMYQSGRNLVIKHNIKDPAVKIRENLIGALQQKYNIKRIASSIAPLEDKSLSSVKRAYKNAADVIFDYRTFEMGFLYYPTKWGRYRIKYMAILRLIDAKSGNVIASSNCFTLQGDDKNPPTRNQLLANNAEVLKMYLGRSVGVCTKLIKTKIFGM